MPSTVSLSQPFSQARASEAAACPHFLTLRSSVFTVAFLTSFISLRFLCCTQEHGTRLAGFQALALCVSEPSLCLSLDLVLIHSLIAPYLGIESGVSVLRTSPVSCHTGTYCGLPHSPARAGVYILVLLGWHGLLCSQQLCLRAVGVPRFWVSRECRCFLCRYC